MITKQELRKQIKLILTDSVKNKTLDIKSESQRICKKIIESEDFAKSPAIFAYMSLPDEVDLSIVIQQALSSGKKVFLPKCDQNTLNNNNGLMAFFEINSMTQTNSGYMGIQEPEGSIEEIPKQQEFYETALILVPGRAFTVNGSRLGRGKGFYDKYLNSITSHYGVPFESKKNRVRLAGICFPQQIVQELPEDEHDFKMDIIFS